MKINIVIKLRYVWYTLHWQRGKPDVFDVDNLKASSDKPSFACMSATAA